MPYSAIARCEFVIQILLAKGRSAPLLNPSYLNFRHGGDIMSQIKSKYKRNHVCKKSFSFRLYDDELERFEQQVAEANCTYTQFIRKCILDKPIIRIDGLPELTVQLIHIGNNLNQLTHAFHAYGVLLTSKELQQIQEDITAMKDKLLSIRR